MSYRLNSEEYGSNESYLYHLYNDLGYSDLEVCYNYYIKGDIRFSKWIKFEYLMHLDYEDKVEGTIDTKRKFLEKITHRSILDIEVLYDFDECDQGSTDPIKIQKYAWMCIKKLNDAGIYGEAYFSGSKSVHYSVLIPELRTMNKRRREDFKNRALSPLFGVDTYRGKTAVSFSADLQKKASRTMIALEGAKHWKTGIVKRRIYNEQGR